MWRDSFLDEDPPSEEEQKARLRPTPDWPVDKDGYPMPCVRCGWTSFGPCAAMDFKERCVGPHEVDPPSAPVHGDPSTGPHGHDPYPA